MEAQRLLDRVAELAQVEEVFDSGSDDSSDGDEGITAGSQTSSSSSSSSGMSEGVLRNPDLGFESVNEVFETDEEGPLERLVGRNRAFQNNEVWSDNSDSSASGSIEDFVSSIGNSVNLFELNVSFDDYDSGDDGDDEEEADDDNDGDDDDNEDDNENDDQ